MEHLKEKHLLRLHDILAPGGPIPLSKSQWWAKVRAGTYPAPVKISERVTCWKLTDILALLESFEEKN